MKIIPVTDFNTFEKLYKDAKEKSVTDDDKSNTIFLFVASTVPQTNESWCPDCVKAKPIIDKVLEDFKFNEHLQVATVQVGQRDEWKSSENPYRLHDLAITNVPTLVSITTVSTFTGKNNSLIPITDILTNKPYLHLFRVKN